ncbi:MAG: 3-phosphoshikimate 1-carboxyvinyltransferase [Burkholderiaceae bacterium]|nr:3-phosphoshikimate 1-carboxyvinyltransferase [Burkholderiaceae bacterium]
MDRDAPPVLTVQPIGHAEGRVRPPGSKSISNRALLLAALSNHTTRLTGTLDADDTRVMIEALRALGVAVDALPGDAGTFVAGCAGRFPRRQADLHLGNAGTAMRPLAAVLAFSGGRYRLDGVARMRERPIGDLVEALIALGGNIRFEAVHGFPPLLIEPTEAVTSDRVAIRGAVSSQFVSGLLMAAPLIAPPAGLRIDVQGRLISEPYVVMTLALMERFGVKVERGDGHFRVTPGQYRSPGTLEVEADASSASYFLALGAIAGGPVTVEGVGSCSIQGDVGFAQLLQKMGAQLVLGPDWIEARKAALTAVDADCSRIPDAAMTAAVVALFAQGTTRLTGIGSWRVKETDRIAAVATELRRLGAVVRNGADWIEIDGPCAVREAAIDTYDDHRMAMCFSLAAAGGVPVHVRDPQCVRKTFPNYFTELAKLCH